MNNINLNSFMNQEKQKTQLEFVSTKELVRSVMNKFISTRNNDTLLIFRCWEQLGIYIDFTGSHIEMLASENELLNAPSAETITRCRREIQNVENDLLPTNMAVLDKRRIREDHIREYYATDSYIMAERLRWVASR